MGEAVDLMRQAVVEAEHLDPSADPKADYCRLVFPLVIIWMQDHARKVAVHEKRRRNLRRF
jgi:hypothetical protein